MGSKSRCCLLAQSEMLGMLYLYGEGFQVLSLQDWLSWPPGCRGLVFQNKWSVAGRGPMPAFLNSKILWDLGLLDFTSSSVFWPGPLTPQDPGEGCAGYDCLNR